MNPLQILSPKLSETVVAKRVETILLSHNWLQT